MPDTDNRSSTPTPPDDPWLRLFDGMTLGGIITSVALFALGGPKALAPWIGVAIAAMGLILMMLRTRSLNRARESEKPSSYVISPDRLRTLEVVGVPYDVRKALVPLASEEPVETTDEEIRKHLETQLGRARAREYAEIVLHYTAQ